MQLQRLFKWYTFMGNGKQVMDWIELVWIELDWIASDVVNKSKMRQSEQLRLLDRQMNIEQLHWLPGWNIPFIFLSINTLNSQNGKEQSTFFVCIDYNERLPFYRSVVVFHLEWFSFVDSTIWWFVVVLCAVFCVLRSVCCVLCSVCYVLYAVRCIQFAICCT